MECIVFPKFFRECAAAELGRRLRDIGFDGVDVMVRDGYWVTEERLHQELPVFVRLLHDFGLSAWNATTDLLDADGAEPAIACLAENGIRQFRLRGFSYRGQRTFHRDLDGARRTLERFQKVCEKHRVRAFLQTHGGTLHASAAAAFLLVQGFDPDYIGVHHDPGNMVCQEGYEEWAKGFDILGDYLCMVGVKNAGTFRSPQGADYRLQWRTEWTTLAEGQVDWRAVLNALAQRGFDGPLCMHNFYERGLAALTAQTREDLRHLRGLLREVSA
jgi:sugar phosphate isomerase/epimerase